MRVRSLLSNFYDPEFVHYDNGQSIKSLVRRIHSTAHLELLQKELLDTNGSSLLSRKILYLSQFDDLDLSPPSSRFIRDMFYEFGFFPLIVKNITLKNDPASFEDAFTLPSQLEYDYVIKIREGEIVGIVLDYGVKLVPSANNLTHLQLLIIPDIHVLPKLNLMKQLKIVTSNKNGYLQNEILESGIIAEGQKHQHNNLNFYPKMIA